MKFDNFCDFFAAIEANPTAIVEEFTIRDYLNARMHIETCQKCKDSADRVLAKAPKDNNIIGFSGN